MVNDCLPYSSTDAEIPSSGLVQLGDAHRTSLSGIIFGDGRRLDGLFKTNRIAKTESRLGQKPKKAGFRTLWYFDSVFSGSTGVAMALGHDQQRYITSDCMLYSLLHAMDWSRLGSAKDDNHRSVNMWDFRITGF